MRTVNENRLVHAGTPLHKVAGGFREIANVGRQQVSQQCALQRPGHYLARQHHNPLAGETFWPFPPIHIRPIDTEESENRPCKSLLYLFR
jgi:hypothetical protein